ncbi:FHA domain-containing protein [Alishewanella sp. d11]|uniref:FHA domain-containing protein n=1 Tax=Alishewanella sp. d11 TaxID=3414030 RepID=UPI003BF83BA0
MAIIIEVLNSRGQSTGLHKFNQAQIRIGRGFDNDLIIQDPHSCAAHAELSRDEQGQWQLRDLQSLNGTLNSQGKRENVIPITKNGQVVTLGKQRLRIILSDSSVAPTLPLTQGWHSLNWLSSTALLISLVLLLSVDFIYSTWLGAIGENAERWHRQLILLPFILLLVLIWPSLLALLARLHSHETKFKQQANLAFTALCCWLLWEKLHTWLSFNFSHTLLLTSLELLAPVVILGAFFWCGFILAGIQNKILHVVLTVSLASIYWAIPYFNSITPNREPSYQADMLPASWLITTPKTTEQFIRDSAALFQQNDSADD